MIQENWACSQSLESDKTCKVSKGNNKVDPHVDRPQYRHKVISIAAKFVFFTPNFKLVFGTQKRPGLVQKLRFTSGTLRKFIFQLAEAKTFSVTCLNSSPKNTGLI